MAFCTKCGASVAGAFCNQCGTPTGLAAAQPAAAGAAPAAAGKISPLVWVLIIILGLFALGIAAVVGTGYFIARHGAGYAVAKMIAASDPNLEVLHTDNGAGTITLRDRRNGQVATLSFDDVQHGRFRMTAQDENGKTASLEVGGSVKAPSWVPMYPGSHPKALFSATGDAGNAMGEGGNFMFTTPDPPSNVLSFYEDQAKALGMKANVTTHGPAADMLIASDDQQQRMLTVVIAKDSAQTGVNVTYGRKR